MWFWNLIARNYYTQFVNFWKGKQTQFNFRNHPKILGSLVCFHSLHSTKTLLWENLRLFSSISMRRSKSFMLLLKDSRCKQSNIQRRMIKRTRSLLNKTEINTTNFKAHQFRKKAFFYYELIRTAAMQIFFKVLDEMATILSMSLCLVKNSKSIY